MSQSTVRSYANASLARSLATSFFLFVLLALALWLVGKARSPLARFAEPGVQVIALEDYRILPKRFTWRAGDTVTLKLVNAALPPTGHEHEIMIGQAPFLRATPVGLLPGHGFIVPFFGSTTIEVLEAKGVKMIMAPKIKVLGGDLVPMPMALGGMGTPAKGAEGGAAMEGMAKSGAMEMGAMAMQMFVGRELGKEERMDLMKDMEEMHGDNMFLIAPGGSVTLRFKVPDRPGLWEMGCFAGEGAHYIDGMRALVEIVGGS